MGNGGETDTLAKLMGGEGTALRYPQGDLRRISREEQLAYVAPFPTDEYKAGARAFPELVPTPDSDPTGRPRRSQWAGRRIFARGLMSSTASANRLSLHLATRTT